MGQSNATDGRASPADADRADTSAHHASSTHDQPEDHPTPDTDTDDAAAAHGPLLAGLTDSQRDAVLATDGPVLVLAAAGSGKTRVITRRVGHLLELGVPPWAILALTFTNKAAGEMRERVAALTGATAPPRGLTVATFHSLCARLLRRYADDPALADATGGGLSADFTIYATADQLALMKRAIADAGMDTSNWPPRSVLSAIGRAKNELIGPERYQADATDFYARQVARLYAAYERAKRLAGAVDFDDLLLLTERLLRRSERARGELRARWRYIMIDEYQDTNRAQFEIAALLAGEANADGRGPAGPNFCVVGDPDQAIYGWRGADVGNILEFEKHYPGARVVPLGENFRSTAPILAAADSLIGHNRRRRAKALYTSRPGGEAVEVVLTADEAAEADLVADWLCARAEDGLDWRSMAVFYRTNSLSRVLEDALRARATPYRIARGTAFYEREEVRNALAYLRLAANPADDQALTRIINTPARGVGKTSFQRLAAGASARGVPLWQALGDREVLDALGPRAAAACERFVRMVQSWTGHGSFLGASVPASLADLVTRVIEESQLASMYRGRAQAPGAGDEEQDRLANLDQLIESAAQFEREYDPAGDPLAFDPAAQGDDASDSPPAAPPPPLLAVLRAWLEVVSLVSDQDAVDQAGGAVTLMTLHASKGLEFPAVAIVGLEEGLLPHARANESEDELEEERRLAFVGITRARERLLITTARVRGRRGVPERTIPSRFLGELGEPEAGRLVVSDRSDAWEPAAAAGRRGNRDADDRPAAALEVGTRVRHPQFGVGRVVSCSQGPGARARVDFAGIGVKTLILEYARLTPLD